ncbi:nudC domain-containing protein 3 isoform X1 [Atheta coriaria]|uniref:nudC domain-containing protein 3 isoform X1 n=1 Tax=Dalotia coriaria TaxID=877792 RepID=UPI0031F4778B
MSIEDFSHDKALLNILKCCKTLPEFLDTIFGFLKRNTDFYEISDSQNSNMGLPPQMAENIVKTAFFKWRMSQKGRIPPSDAPPISSSEAELTGIPNEAIASSSMAPNESKKQNLCFISAECYNGAVTDQYMWSQTINDLDVAIALDGNVLPKHLVVELHAKHILVKNKLTQQTVLIGDLPHSVKHSEAIWWVTAQKLEIHLDKMQERWWDRLFTHEKPLDVSKLDCSRPFNELSDEAQAKIEELQYNQDRWRQGLASRPHKTMESTLKEAWNAKGSPFSGSYDCSKVILEN